MDKKDVLIYFLIAMLFACAFIFIVFAVGLIFSFDGTATLPPDVDAEVVVAGVTYEPGDDLALNYGSVVVGPNNAAVEIRNVGNVPLTLTAFTTSMPDDYTLTCSIPVNTVIPANDEVSGNFVLTVPEDAEAGTINFTCSLTLSG